ncbi:MAG: CHASE2 domain-containing protein [Betaproteobacteria bacterium]|nr:CHASE2 domain-containing protein [Betaproteobacteria bacterium]
MKKASFWKKDWFLGVVIVITISVLAILGYFEALETKAYDLGVTATSKQPSDKIAVIAIDDQSIANIGRWPWSREIHAKMIDKLAEAKIVGNTVFFFEPQKDPGLVYVNKMLEIYNKAAGVTAPSDTPVPTINPEFAQIGALLTEAELALNTDRQLGDSIKKAGNVLLPSLIEADFTPPIGKPDKATPEFVLKNAIAASADSGAMYGMPGAQFPIDSLGQVAAGIGHVTDRRDIDGGRRRDVTVVDYAGQKYPSLAMLLAARSLNLGSQDIRVTKEAVSIGTLRITTDENGLMLPYFYKSTVDRPAIPTDSFYEVLTGKIPATKYKDKVVLIGGTAVGVGEAAITPVGLLSPVEKLGHSVSSILQQHFFRTPVWAQAVTLLAYLLVGAYIIAMLPRLSAGAGAVVTLLLFIALIGTHFAFMMGPGVWVKLMMPAGMLVIGHLLLTTKRFLVTERGKEQSDAAGAESNRMLGLAFQQQGQLDMAFDKFRKCPVDEQLLENIYSLALDFERRRQFNKAESAFLYIHQNNPKFRDVAERMNRAKAMSETIILGGSSAARSAQATMVVSGGAEKPMLGRYQVEKELGKGAMGVVYLGKDPKIGREVAIKTMALSVEFEGEELQDAKDRFFREAESAGKLDHPNIVRIFDAGEEHDLAYIAMEFLKGRDLVPYTKNPNLLPLSKVLSLIERVAEALHHAHAMGIVHRDIKPANIMYDSETDTPKVTDFGIARVTDSSKTKTGMVLGTPSYMSPEQLAGKKIDGRSDLFSLGVTLYQLSCGRLPFEGESMTQLMFAIANEPHPSIRGYNPALPDWMEDLIDHALAKNAEQRFQNGAEFATAIRTYRQIG